MRLVPLIAVATLLAVGPAVAGSATQFHWLVKPTVGADADVWGAKLNRDLDKIDRVLVQLCTHDGGTPSANGCDFPRARRR